MCRIKEMEEEEEEEEEEGGGERLRVETRKIGSNDRIILYLGI